MWRTPAAAHRDRAAQESLERIRRDRQRAGGRVRPLLDHIAAHLFDPELRVRRLKEACRARDNSIVLRFRDEVGVPPSVYIRERRMETAASLLRDTRILVGRIGELVGYPEPVTFTRAYKRWAGRSPVLYRRQAARSPGAAARPYDRWSTALLRGAVVEELPAERAAAALAQLRFLHGMGESSGAC